MKNIIIISLTIAFLACSASTRNMTGEVTNEKVRTISDEVKNYWYSGTAEISSYKLTQARYGELREGEAVMVCYGTLFCSVQYKSR